MYLTDKKISKSRQRIISKRTDIETAYQRAKDNSQPIEVLIDELAEKHGCTRDNVRYIIRMYRRRLNLNGKEVSR